MSQNNSWNNFLGAIGLGRGNALDNYLGQQQSGLDSNLFTSAPLSYLNDLSRSDPSMNYIPSFSDKMFGYQDQNGRSFDGWGKTGLGALQALGGAYMGMKQYGLAKDSLEENKRQFNTNYAAQRTTTNAAMEDRQRARVAANPGAHQPVGSYMDQNRIR